MDFDFVGGAYEAPSIYQDAQELINWYCEIDPEKQDAAYEGSLGRQVTRGVIALYPTPGYTAKVTLPFAEIRGIHTLSGGANMIAVCGSTVYIVNSSFSASFVGTLLSNVGPVSIKDNGLAVYMADGNNRYSCNMTGGSFAVIPSTDGAFTGADIVDVADNYFVYNRPNTQQWAASTALSTATPALSFSSKDGAPDNLVAFIVVSREVWLLGERTSEVWTDTGAFPFPFARIPGTNTQHGCAAKNSVSRIGETFAFVSQDTRGQGIIVHGQGYGFVRLSTHAVENSIMGKTISDARAFTYQIEGHEFYVVTFPSIDLTWVYDLVTNKWHKWLSVDGYNVFHRQRANCHAVFQGLNLIGDYQNGIIYALDNTVYTENGAAIRRVRRCPHLVNDFKRLYLEELQLQFQPGTGLQSGQGKIPQAMLKWSNDGGSTWSNEHWKTIGAVGKYKNRAIWRRLGMARDRIFEVSITDPVRAVIISANLVASAGEH